MPPDALLRLIDRFSQDHRVFLSPDYKGEQLRPAFPTGRRLAISHLDFLVRTFSSPFFAALGWNMQNSIDTIRSRNRGSVRLSPGGFVPLYRLVVCMVLLVVASASGRKADWTIYLPDSLSWLGSPRCIEYNPANNTVYAGGGTFVIAIDCSTNKTVARIAAGSCGALFYNPVNDMVYCMGNPVTIIDGNSNTVIDTISVSSGGGFCHNSRRNKLYFFSSNQGSGTVTVVDVVTKAIVTSIRVGQFPAALCYNSQNDRVYRHRRRRRLGYRDRVRWQPASGALLQSNR
jgi:YVTN family beta-propeller protein